MTSKNLVSYPSVASVLVSRSLNHGLMLPPDVTAWLRAPNRRGFLAVRTRDVRLWDEAVRTYAPIDISSASVTAAAMRDADGTIFFGG